MVANSFGNSSPPQSSRSRDAFAMRSILLVVMLTALPAAGADLFHQSAEDAAQKSAGCMSTHCHEQTDAPTMHHSDAVQLGCIDCHGGRVQPPVEVLPGSASYEDAKTHAHVLPTQRDIF